MPKYWINSISRDHVMLGVAGGYTQADHGKNTRLKRLQAGDWMIFYSGKQTYPDGAPLQAFTAIGQVSDDELYQVETAPDWHPWRRNMTFLKSHETPIRPLLDDLSFIHDKQRWGYPFKFGLFQIPAADFELIKRAMTE